MFDQAILMDEFLAMSPYYNETATATIQTLLPFFSNAFASRSTITLYCDPESKG
jgi:hypothetical protein